MAKTDEGGKCFDFGQEKKKLNPILISQASKQVHKRNELQNKVESKINKQKKRFLRNQLKI